MFESMNERLTSYGVIPVVVLNKASSAVQLGRALEAGGLDLAEITFRTAAAEESIRLMSRAFPNMLIGAGTVLTIDQVNRAVAAGAKFIVSPAFDPELVDYCIKRDIPVYPGVATPTEALMGIKRGLTLMKFFPAEQFGGIKAIQAICAALKGIRFMPTGGINKDNLHSYLESPLVGVAGGSWMVKSSMIDAGEFDKITALCKEAVGIVDEIRCPEH